VVAGYSLVVAVADAVFDNLVIFGQSPRGDTFLTIAVATATFAYALITYQLLQANIRQIEEQRRANRQQIEAIERQARVSAESAQDLLTESVRTRRDDHAPAVTVSVIQKRRGHEQHQPTGWQDTSFPRRLDQEDFDEWRAWVFVRFCVRNDGPGIAVIDLRGDIPHGELKWPAEAPEETRRMKAAVLRPGSELEFYWRYEANAGFWWDQARRGWSPPPIPDNPWMLEFPLISYPPSNAVVDYHMLSTPTVDRDLHGC